MYLDTLWHTMLCMQLFEHTLRGSGLSAFPALVDTVQCDPKTLDDGLRGTVHGTLRKTQVPVLVLKAEGYNIALRKFGNWHLH